MKISEHFLLEEFVSKNTFDKFGAKSIWFVDKGIIAVAEKLRAYFGKSITINNWHNGGTLNSRGFRERACVIGGEFSIHRLGKAIDFNVDGLTAQAVHRAVLDKHAELWPEITAIEDVAFTSNWTHIDLRPSDIPEIMIVKPS